MGPRSFAPHASVATRCCCGLIAAHALERGAERERAAVADLAATAPTVASGSRSRSAASASRQPVRNAIGGSPTSSVKRRASAARETPASAASAATVHGCAGSLCSSRSAWPTTGSLWARYHAGASASGRANQARSDGDEQQVEQPVEHRLLAGLVLDDLVGEQRRRAGQSHASAAQHEQRRQRVEQPPADLALDLVGAGEHHRRAVGAVAPACARRGPSPDRAPRRRAWCSAGRGG